MALFRSFESRADHQSTQAVQASTTELEDRIAGLEEENTKLRKAAAENDDDVEERYHMDQLVSESAQERRWVEAELTTQTANEASECPPYSLGL